ncbi:MAG: CatB-related O-acetyltransferase [Selenomonadaceae bacterium]|nr:CatB-related O-acetyltransferase [Selenomonadaceae bacterium]
MAYKALIFGTDDLYPTLKPFYDAQAKSGNLEIVATAELVNNTFNLVYADGKKGRIEDIPNFDIAIISSHGYFYSRMKLLEGFGLPRNRIIDGRVFQVPNLDFSRLLKEGIAYGIIEKQNSFRIEHNVIYPQMYSFKDSNSTFFLDKKSYISKNTNIERDGDIHVGKFSALSWNILFEFQLSVGHNISNISQYSRFYFDWSFPKEFMSPQGMCKTLIGSDVWIGRGCILKSINPDKPLVIGDGAAIASDSVVVKNVPPYAIVGGNPAKVIKYRFPPHVIKALLRIKWWDWSLDKIYDNFKYFNDVEKLISLHDPLKDADTPEDDSFLGYDIENTFDLDMDKIRNNFR